MSQYAAEFYVELKRISFSIEEIEKLSSSINSTHKEILVQMSKNIENARNDDKIKSELYLDQIRNERRKIQRSIFWMPVVFFGFYKILHDFNFI